MWKLRYILFPVITIAVAARLVITDWMCHFFAAGGGEFIIFTILGAFGKLSTMLCAPGVVSWWFDVHMTSQAVVTIVAIGVICLLALVVGVLARMFVGGAEERTTLLGLRLALGSSDDGLNHLRGALLVLMEVQGALAWLKQVALAVGEAAAVLVEFSHSQDHRLVLLAVPQAHGQQLPGGQLFLREQEGRGLEIR